MEPVPVTNTLIPARTSLCLSRWPRTGEKRGAPRPSLSPFHLDCQLSQLVPEQAEEREDTLLQPNQDTSASSHICLHTSLLSTNTMRCRRSSDFILTEHTMNLAEYRNPKCLRFKGQPMKPKFSKKILSLNFNLK